MKLTRTGPSSYFGSNHVIGPGIILAPRPSFKEKLEHRQGREMHGDVRLAWQALTWHRAEACAVPRRLQVTLTASPACEIGSDYMSLYSDSQTLLEQLAAVIAGLGPSPLSD